ncbi:POT peptide transporter [Aspergillus caelatus]|uniref:POT peptide transporter n=1 Tax=Aspergillus caelatus TaxID=61420 RepID=A0A5N6ZXJ9_9EURO|nr:POT peptide transporter [Aspergillus caelatus]KAE8361010.1 POT peptide transporter [Aspergillus caelatus]
MESRSWESLSNESQASSGQTLLSDDPKPGTWAEPKEVERSDLRLVRDDISLDIFLVAVAELSERFTYRAVTAPIQNYIQNTRDDPLHPGALGMGQTVATSINYVFVGWCYLSPVLMGIIADSLLGRYKTIVMGTGLSACGVLILFSTSLPVSLEHGAGLPGLMAALVLLGLGTGAIKSNVAPLIAEQYHSIGARVKSLPDGEQVLVDPNVTIQAIYARYYWVINLGALSVIPVSWLELKVDFWAAFMLPLCFWALAIVALLAGRTRYIVQPPNGSAITKAMRVLWIGIKSGGSLEAARPSSLEKTGVSVQWDDVFVDELKRALVACRVFLIFPLYWICNGQASSNLVSQGASMDTHGIPNDMMGCLNPITILIAVPLFERFVYPTLHRFHIKFKPISRITTGFLLASCAMALAAGLQELIYETSPCQRNPTTDSCKGVPPARKISLLLQIPVYCLMGLSELLAMLSGMEYAYTKAPKSMRSIIMSLFLLAGAFGSSIGVSLSPTSVDPKVLIEYVSLSATMLVAAIIFFLCFRKYNRMEESMNKLLDADCPRRRSWDTDDTPRLERQ